MKPTLNALALLTLLAALLAGCATEFPAAPKTVQQADYNYRIGPNDVLNVVVWRNPELSGTLPVRPDGKLSAPLVDDIQVIGRTPSEVERELEKSLSKYIRDPVVTVMVTNFVGPTNENVRVIGEVVKPQVLPYRKDMTLLDAMIAVGGMTDFADGNAGRIYRVADGGKVYSVRVRDLVKRGDIEANVDLRPGDVVIIPQSWF
jgi:polysaccharide export outer membrane protein